MIMMGKMYVKWLRPKFLDILLKCLSKFLENSKPEIGQTANQTCNHENAILPLIYNNNLLDYNGKLIYCRVKC